MLGSRRRVQPHSNAPDMYAERLNSSLSVYNAEPSVPVSTFATTRSPISSIYRLPTIGPKVRAFFKSGKFRDEGLEYNWAWGATDQGQHTASLPYGGGMDGTVRSTQYQRVLVQLHNWQMNRKWYIAWNGTGGGVFNQSNPIRYEYPSFRVPQINTALSGGAGPASMRMQQRPRFSAVQKIRRASVSPRYYNTVSRNTGGNSGGATSTNTNTPGV